MKKHLRYFALLLVLCLFLTACGGKAEGPNSLTPDEPQSLTPDEPQQDINEPAGNNTLMLTTDAEPLKEMEAVKRDHYDNGTYYYMDLAGENALRCINSSYLNSIREGETEEEYAQRRAIGMSMTLTPGNPYNLSVGQADELSEALGYPVYLVTFLTGSDLNATCWTVYLTRTEHYSYQYAFAASSQTSLELEDKIMEYFGTLELAYMPQA
jgi:predicted small lipoprotein YifL